MRALGTGIALALPAAWLAGTVVGVSPYRDYPMAAAAALGLLEVALAGLLLGPWRAADRIRQARKRAFTPTGKRKRAA